MTDLQHKFNCQTQEGYHGGTNRAYWCSCALEERKEIKSLQQRIAELEEKIKTAENWDVIDSRENEKLQQRIAELENRNTALLMLIDEDKRTDQSDDRI